MTQGGTFEDTLKELTAHVSVLNSGLMRLAAQHRMDLKLLRSESELRQSPGEEELQETKSFRDKRSASRRSSEEAPRRLDSGTVGTNSIATNSMELQELPSSIIELDADAEADEAAELEPAPGPPPSPTSARLGEPLVQAHRLTVTAAPPVADANAVKRYSNLSNVSVQSVQSQQLARENSGFLTSSVRQVVPVKSTEGHSGSLLSSESEPFALATCWARTRGPSKRGSAGTSGPSSGPSSARGLFQKQMTGRKQASVQFTHKNSSTRLNLDTTQAWTALRSTSKILWIDEQGAKYVASPASPTRVMWDFLGTFFIFYDILAIPFAFFSPKEHTLTMPLQMLTTIFWSTDFVLSFFVGFHEKGRIELRMSRIARKYLRTWMIFDLLLVTFDWAWLVMQDIMDIDLGFARLFKSARFARVFRVVRMLRLLKLNRMMGELLEMVESESTLIVLGIVKIFIFICLVTHVIACCFWGLGNFPANEDTPTWVKQFNLEHRTIFYQYTSSLHWSLTQFTPASMEIVPANGLERLYTVITILLAMMTFSSLVSSLTNALTQLRKLESVKLAQESTLRRYLVENNVHALLRGRIWSWLHAKGPVKQQRRTHEEDVFLLEMLPTALSAELQEQVYAPRLEPHPFFFQLMEEDKISHVPVRVFVCLQETSVMVGKEIFSMGNAATQMYFLLQGTMTYNLTRHASADMDGDYVLDQGKWACEPALWVNWKHRGTMVAKEHSELIGVKVDHFRNVMQRHWTNAQYCMRYAKQFVALMNENRELVDDVWTNFDSLRDMAMDAACAVQEQMDASPEGSYP